MISTKGVEDTQVTEGKYINPGVHEVKITKVEGHEPSGGSPYYHFFFEDAKGKTAEIKLYASEKALPATLAKIKHMATKVVKETDLDGITGKNHTEYATKLSRLISNKKFRIKFCGEEIEGKTMEDGTKKNNWTKAVIGYYVAGKTPPFAEAITTTETKLKYDPTNAFDLKKLDKADAETTTYKKTEVAVSATPDDDMPF